MRKDLMLASMLTGLTLTTLQADPGSRDRNGADSSISSDVTHSGDRGIGAAQDFRRETPGTLGSRGTIGQDGTGFTGQERIGTLPPGRLGFYKTNDYDKSFEHANDELKQSDKTGERSAFDPSAAGGPASSQSGGASHIDPAASAAKAPRPASGAVSPADSGPAGLAGETGRYNGKSSTSDAQPVTPGSQTSGVVGHETDSAQRGLTNAPSTAQGSAPASAVGSANGSNPGNGSPNPDVALRPPGNNNSQEDRQMSRRIRQQLISSSARSKVSQLTPAQLQQVEVKAANGEVTLSGSVENFEQKREIEARVKEMTGVASVKNELALKGADSKTDNASKAAK